MNMVQSILSHSKVRPQDCQLPFHWLSWQILSLTVQISLLSLLKQNTTCFEKNEIMRGSMSLRESNVGRETELCLISYTLRLSAC